MEPHVLLLRGVNVGGKNRLPMAELAAIVRDAGAHDVRTYIQSGNVVCSVAATDARAVCARVEAAVAVRFGFRAPVVARSTAEWAAVLDGDPFGDEARTHVAFLADAPASDRVAALDPDRSPGDRFLVRGAEVYLHLPNGVGRTRLTNDWLDRALGTTATVRNWRTVQALATLLAPR